MPKIKVEITVPDNDCEECKKSRYHYFGIFKCSQFDVEIKYVNGILQRCQECLDAEVSHE